MVRTELVTKFGITQILEEVDNKTVILRSGTGGLMEKEGSVIKRLEFGPDLVFAVGDMMGEYKIEVIDYLNYNSDTNLYSYRFSSEKVQPLVETETNT